MLAFDWLQMHGLWMAAAAAPPPPLLPHPASCAFSVPTAASWCCTA